MNKKCLKCGYVRTEGDSGPDHSCPKCQAVYSKVEAAQAAAAAQEERIAQARASGNWSSVDPALVRQEANSVLVLTTETVPGVGPYTAVGIVSADYSYAFGALYENIAGFARNLAGSGNSGRTSKFLAEGRAQVIDALKFEALDCNAHAVVAVRFDYEEFSGANNQGILVVTATGTAIRFAERTGRLS